MKNITLIFAMLLMVASTYGQSLAEQTGEHRSLYDAVCIFNDIEPGTIGMTEGRKLMQRYAKSVGLEYELYEFNGGNNLYILHFDEEDQLKPEYRSDAIDANDELDYSMVGAHANVSASCSGCVEGNNTKPNKIEYNEVTPVTVIEVGTGVINIDTKKKDTIQINDIEPIEVKHINNNQIIAVPVHIPADEHEYVCDCKDKTVEELNQYYTELLKLRRQATGLLKDKLNACSYQLRKYKKTLERDERVSHRDTAKIEDGSVSFEQVLPNMNISSSLVSYKPVKVTKTKKRRTRKLGRGYARGKNNSFLSKLFPFRGC